MTSEFKLPETHAISIEVDGVQHQGDWSVFLRDLHVYFNGHVLSCGVPEFDLEAVASNMLKTLVQQHYTPIAALRDKVPEHMLAAAHAYLNSFDDDQPVNQLIEAFGDLELNSNTYEQVAWLAVNATGMVVPYWKYMCDDNAPEEIYAKLQNWLVNSSVELDWEQAGTLCIATREGETVADCDSCRLEPIAKAVASLAIYLRTADPLMAKKCLFAAESAHDEGCYRANDLQAFKEWLVFVALPCSLKKMPVPAKKHGWF